MKIFKWMLALSGLLVAWYWVWCYTGKDYSTLHPAAVSINITSDGTDRGKGNLLAIQPYLTAADYCNRQHFQDALLPYFKKALAAGMLQPKTVVVLPENIGTWLAFADEKTTVYRSDSMRKAVATVVNSNIFSFIKCLMYTPADDKIKHAFIYMKAPGMIDIYTTVFSALAKEFNVTIAAGSILLPQPSLDARGRIRVKKGQLYYSAFVFNRSGKIQARPVLKKLPEYDGTKTMVAADSNLSVVCQTPAGRIVVTANNSYRTGKVSAGIFVAGSDKIWDAVWKGSKGFAIPPDAIRKNEDTSLLERFRDQPVTASLKPARALTSLHVENRFTGSLWEIYYENKLRTLQADSLFATAPVKQQGSIVCTWFQ